MGEDVGGILSAEHDVEDVEAAPAPAEDAMEEPTYPITFYFGNGAKLVRYEKIYEAHGQK